MRNDLLGLALGKGSVSQEGLVKLCGRRQVISKVVRETQELLQRGGEGGSPLAIVGESAQGTSLSSLPHTAGLSSLAYHHRGPLGATLCGLSRAKSNSKIHSLRLWEYKRKGNWVCEEGTLLMTRQTNHVFVLVQRI